MLGQRQVWKWRSGNVGLVPYEGQTALAVPVSEADALLRAVAAQFPGVVREGVPAHVSVQYPFLAASDLDDGVVGALSSLFAVQRPLRVTFADCRRIGGFVFLRPDPVDELATLTAQVRQRWPAVARPDGLDGEVGPHLTVAMRASEEDAETIERQVITALPISTELREVWLVAFEDRWVLRSRFEFGVAR